MALIHCPECQNEVSSVAVACPQCAFPYPGRKESGNGQLATSLRTCPECKRVISKGVSSCPHCGAPGPDSVQIPETLSAEDGEETLTCPHCGVSFSRGPTSTPTPIHSIEGEPPLHPIEEKILAAQSRIGLGIEEEEAEEELPGDPTFSAGRRKKPLWEAKSKSLRESPRHARSHKPWNTLLVVMLVILLIAAGWIIWELRDMSGLEALVYWNR